jgi:hypothetical protein
LRHEQPLETLKFGVPRSQPSKAGTAMASTSSPAPAVAPKDQMATDAFLSSLAELRSMPHTHVSEKPVGRAEKPNDFGVLVTLNIPEKKRKQKRFAVTGPKGDRPNLIAATQEAKKWVNEQLTEAGIEATLPEQPPPQQAATPEELELLAAWIDEQPDPSAITMVLALDWLQGQRAKASVGGNNGAADGPSAGRSPCARS